MLIGLLIAGGIAMIIVGLLRSGNDAGAGDDASAAGTQSEGGSLVNPEQVAPPPAAEKQPQPRSRRRSFSNRFAIGVPAGWRVRRSAGGVALIAPGGFALIRVFSESPASPPRALAAPTASFLADQYPGARISRPHRARQGRLPAYRIAATYPGGAEVATVTSAGGVSFLVTCRTDTAAPEAIRREARASCAGFRPR